MDDSFAVQIKASGHNFHWGLEKKDEDEDLKKTKKS